MGLNSCETWCSSSKQGFVQPADVPPRMRAWREARGFKVTTVAKRIGVTKGAISQWESDELPALPTLRNLFAFCDAIGVPFVMFVACEPEPLGLGLEDRCVAAS